MDENLLWSNCPWCQTNDDITVFFTSDDKFCAMKCGNCGAQGPEVPLNELASVAWEDRELEIYYCGCGEIAKVHFCEKHAIEKAQKYLKGVE